MVKNDRFLGSILLAAALAGCNGQSPAAKSADAKQAVTPPLKATVSDNGTPTTAPMTREQTEASPQQQEILDKVAQTLKGKTAKDYYERGTTYLMVAEEASISAAYGLAAKDFSEAIKLDPKMVGAYSNRAMAYVRAGEVEKALADFDAAAKLAPTNAQILGSKASVLAKLGRDKEAIAVYDQAVKLGGGAPLMFNRGNAHLRLGQTDQAKRDFAQVAKESDSPQLVEAAKGNLEALK